MKVKKVLKVIGIVLIILVVLLLIHTLRNFVIVSKLQNNISKYAESTNYHIKSVETESNGIILTVNSYKKGDKQVSFIERNKNGEVTKISAYRNNDKMDIFYDNPNSKMADLNADAIFIEVNIYNYLESDSTWHTILSSMFANIRSTEINGKKCYVVNNYTSFVSLMPVGKNECYIEKDTGLMIRNVTNDMINDREFEFDNVNEEVFIEPDISEYTIQGNE